MRKTTLFGGELLSEIRLRDGAAPRIRAPGYRVQVMLAAIPAWPSGFSTKVRLADRTVRSDKGGYGRLFAPSMFAHRDLRIFP